MFLFIQGFCVIRVCSFLPTGFAHFLVSLSKLFCCLSLLQVGFSFYHCFPSVLMMGGVISSNCGFYSFMLISCCPVNYCLNQF